MTINTSCAPTAAPQSSLTKSVAGRYSYATCPPLTIKSPGGPISKPFGKTSAWLTRYQPVKCSQSDYELESSRNVRVDNRQSLLIADSGKSRCRGLPSFFSASL
jgi:hypothetical protein